MTYHAEIVKHADYLNMKLQTLGMQNISHLEMQTLLAEKRDNPPVKRKENKKAAKRRENQRNGKLYF